MRICTHPKHLLSSRLYCRFRIRTGSAAQCAVHGLPRSESERCHRRSGIYESLISPCPEELLFTLPHYCMHVALICQPVFSISLLMASSGDTSSAIGITGGSALLTVDYLRWLNDSNTMLHCRRLHKVEHS